MSITPADIEAARSTIRSERLEVLDQPALDQFLSLGEADPGLQKAQELVTAEALLAQAHIKTHGTITNSDIQRIKELAAAVLLEGREASERRTSFGAEHGLLDAKLDEAAGTFLGLWRYGEIYAAALIVAGIEKADTIRRHEEARGGWPRYDTATGEEIHPRDVYPELTSNTALSACSAQSNAMLHLFINYSVKVTAAGKGPDDVIGPRDNILVKISPKPKAIGAP